MQFSRLGSNNPSSSHVQLQEQVARQKSNQIIKARQDKPDMTQQDLRQKPGIRFGCRKALAVKGGQGARLWPK
jgi:hypothetical protein